MGLKRRGDPSAAIIIKGNIATVQLSNGKLAIIDAEDAEVIASLWWCYDGQGYPPDTGRSAEGKNAPTDIAAAGGNGDRSSKWKQIR